MTTREKVLAVIQKYGEAVDPQGWQVSELDEAVNEITAEIEWLQGCNRELLNALKAIIVHSDNGDIIEPGWYEIDNGRAAVARSEGREA